MKRFLRERCGQDLAEYSLLIAFIALVALAIVIRTSGGLNGIWTAANATLATANSSSSGSGSASSAAAGHPAEGDR